MRGDSHRESDLKYRDMIPGEEQTVLALVLRGFDRFVRPDFSDEGVAEFTRVARSFVVEHPEGHHVTVAERDGQVVGMIDVRDSSHVSLFFMEPAEQGRGLGRALLTAALAKWSATGAAESAVTVYSSPWAVPVYERLGFLATGPETEHKGIRAVPMAMRP
jgi:GNAT superfamily N-acetyltransferase